MKLIPLSQGLFAKVDDEHYEWLMQWKWCASKNTNSDTFYAQRSDYTGEKRKTVSMHRLILGLTDKNIHCDHVNRDGLDNQMSNLRPATRSQNLANRKSSANASSKYLGVARMKKNIWGAAICKEGKKTVKCFRTEIEAAIAYNEMAKIVHGEFARLNEIPAI